MDLFKRKNNNEATSWDWNCPKFVKRAKGDTKRLHKLSRKRLKNELNKNLDRVLEKDEEFIQRHKNDIQNIYNIMDDLEKDKKYITNL